MNIELVAENLQFPEGPIAMNDGSVILTESKRGTLTLPPELRRRLKLDQVASPLVIVEERDGGLFLQSAVAMPIRDIPKATIRQWVLNDEADAKDLKAFRRKK